MNLPLLACAGAGVIITAGLLWVKNGITYVENKTTLFAFGVQVVLAIVCSFYFEVPAIQRIVYTAAVVALGLAIVNNKKS